MPNIDRPLCIYHANCADGFTAAWIIHTHFNGNVDFHPGVYQDAPPNVTGREVILVDFSYKRPIMERMIQDAAKVTIIDHHKSAIEDLAGLNCPKYFDVTHSGAMLTWKYFQPIQAEFSDAPKLVQYVEDRDLWKFQLCDSRSINAWIFSYDYSFENWDTMAHQLEDFHGEMDAAKAGIAIERKHHKDVAELVKVTKRHMYFVTPLGPVVLPVACVPYTLVSDAGHLLATEATHGTSACYWDTPEGRCFGLRSTEQGLDVSEIAKLYGGGGHKHAAGFRVPFAELAEKGLL